MTRKRCRACRRRFLPERPIDRYCNACWATRQAGLAPGWLHQRDLDIGHQVDDAVARDDLRERR